MSRSKLKCIISWVNSHISDSPRAIIFFRFFCNLTRITKLTIFVFFVSLYLLFFVSPFLGIFSLFIFTLYLLYNKKYKGIFFIWGSFLFLWYLVFTVCLIGYDGPILFIPDTCGGYLTEEDMDMYNETVRLLFFLLKNNFKVKGFCMQTLALLWWISLELNITIYLPSLLKGILALFKFLCGVWGGKGRP